MEDILKNNFNTIYSEWKLYGDFIKKNNEIVAKERSEFNDFAKVNSQNTDLLVNKLFELTHRQTIHQIEYNKLTDRLLNVYEAYKLVIDIPKEVAEEINSFPKQDMLFKVVNGVAVVVNPEKIEEVKASLRANFEKMIKDMGNNE
jgi:antitoxin component of MazEF toxin-antitoxin module